MLAIGDPYVANDALALVSVRGYGIAATSDRLCQFPNPPSQFPPNR
jgi:hypothetical protein